jgi:hypothetical protein
MPSFGRIDGQKCEATEPLGAQLASDISCYRGHPRSEVSRNRSSGPRTRGNLPDAQERKEGPFPLQETAFQAESS